MKKQTKKVAGLVIGASGCIGVALMAACGGGDNGGLSTPSIGAPKTISTAAEAKKALASITVVQNELSGLLGSGFMSKVVGKTASKTVSAAIPEAASLTSANNGTKDLSADGCPAGGKWTRSISLNADGSGTVTDKLEACAESTMYFTENAVYVEDSSITYNFVNSNNFSASGSSKGKLKVADVVKLENSLGGNFSIVTDPTTKNVVKASVNMTGEEKNLVLNSSGKESINNLQYVGNADGKTFTINSGAMAKELTLAGAQAAYVGVTFAPGFKITSVTGSKDINGKFAIKVLPASACTVDGTYEVTTTASGEILINGTAKRDAYGKVTVGTDTDSYFGEFSQQCEIFTKVNGSIY